MSLRNFSTVYKRVPSLTPLFVLLFCVLYFCIGQRIPVNDGVGWDGMFYCKLAKNFASMISTKEISSYHISRILPSGLIYLCAKIFHYSVDNNTNVIKAFFVLNTVLMTVGSYFWLKISQISRFTFPVFWIGFCGLFLNWVFTTQFQYYGVLTDTTAEFFGILVLYLYVTHRPFLICVTALFASFTWPLTAFFCFLLLFDKKSKISVDLKGDKISQQIMLLLYAGGLILFSVVKPEVTIGWGVDKHWLWLCIILACVYIHLITKYFHLASQFREQLKNFKYYSKNILLYFFLFIMLCGFALKGYLAGDAPSYGAKDFFTQFLFLTPLVHPGASFVAHVAYFGPLIIIAVLIFKSSIKTALNSSVGLYLFYFFTLILSIDSESRHLVFNYPFFVYIICLTIKTQKFNRYFVTVFTLLSILVSKVYFDLYPFPDPRLYFMNTGPWMSSKAFIFHLSLLLFSTFILVYYWKATTSEKKKEIETFNAA